MKNATGRRAGNFFSLISSDQAYQHIGGFAPLGTEAVGWRESLGRVLAADVVAANDVPHFVRSNMDGYAVRAEDTFGATDASPLRLRLSGEVAMGSEAAVKVEKGCLVRVSTGAMMPPGADAVVIVENTEEDGAGGVLLRTGAVPGQNTIKIGEELQAGETVIRAGRRIKAADLGALTVAGADTVAAHRRPRAGIIVTGDEIVDPGRELQPGEVRNVNQYVLCASAAGAGAEVHDYGVIGDDPRQFAAALARATPECDAIFLSGGSSKGRKDFSLSSIAALPGGEIVFHGVAIAPGKPTILARAGKCAVMGLPGNPAAAAIVFALFGATLLRVLGGEHLDKILATRALARVVVGEDIRSTQGREDYIRVRIDAAVDGLPVAFPLRGKSAAITTMARADGLLRVPQSSEGAQAGTVLEVMLL